MSEHHLGEDLAAMADGGRGLAPDRKRELEAHAEGCAECRAAIRSAQLVLRVVDARAEPVPSPGFDAALFRRLDALDRAPAPEPWWAKLAAYFTLPRLAVAGAVAAAVLLVFVLGRPVDDAAVSGVTPEVAQVLDALGVAEDLELYEDMEVVEDLDVLADLDVIQEMDDAG